VNKFFSHLRDLRRNALTFAARNDLMKKPEFFYGGGKERETDIQTERQQAEKSARIPQAHEHEKRPESAESPPP